MVGVHAALRAALYDAWSASVYVSLGNAILRLVESQQCEVVHVAGNASAGESADGTGDVARLECRFQTQLASDNAGRLFFIDSALRIRKPDGTSDVAIRVGERRFCCHRAILCARCDYFQQRLAGGSFRDGLQGDIDLPDAEPEAFAQLLRWLYTGAADVPPEHARAVAELADRLLLPQLCDVALEVLLASVSAEGVVEVLLWAAGAAESRGAGGCFGVLLGALKRWCVCHHGELSASVAR
eukprot:XP_001698217.1 predicted protein [Chlamydomonas reinhardtii]